MEHQQRRPEAVGRAARVVRHGEQLPPQRCPRCDSNNTKFCYFNNYSSSQPRYFCKTCRRYWTHGGTLRNVPQGGGGRKGKRSKRSSASATTVDNHPPTQHPLDVEPSITAPAMPSVFYGGGVGMIGDLGGSILAAPAATIPTPFDHRFFHGLNFQLGGGYPSQPQQLLGFNLDMTSQSRAPSENPPQGLQYQPHQLNTSLFTTTTTTTTTTTGAGDGTEGYWRDLASGEGSSFWIANQTGFVPRPPSPPPFI